MRALHTRPQSPVALGPACPNRTAAVATTSMDRGGEWKKTSVYLATTSGSGNSSAPHAGAAGRLQPTAQTRMLYCLPLLALIGLLPFLI